MELNSKCHIRERSCLNVNRPLHSFVITEGITLKTTDGIKPALQRVIVEVSQYLETEVRAVTYFEILKGLDSWGKLLFFVWLLLFFFLLLLS